MKKTCENYGWDDNGRYIKLNCETCGWFNRDILRCNEPSLVKCSSPSQCILYGSKYWTSKEQVDEIELQQKIEEKDW